MVSLNVANVAGESVSEDGQNSYTKNFNQVGGFLKPFPHKLNTHWDSIRI